MTDENPANKPRRSRSPIGRVTQPRPVACDRCGTPHQRCIGHRTTDEGLVPCGAWPIRGAEVCGAHGGRAPQVRAQAKQRLAEAKAREAVATYGIPIEIGPSEALLEELHRTAGHVAWLARIVAELEPDDLVWGLVEETDRPAGERSMGGVETKHKAVPNQWLLLYQKERHHLAQVSKACVDAGISERVVQMWEQLGSRYVQVIERVLDRLELTVEQRGRVPGLIQEELGPIAGGTT
jgi:hypothetical protein